MSRKAIAHTLPREQASTYAATIHYTFNGQDTDGLYYARVEGKVVRYAAVKTIQDYDKAIKIKSSGQSKP